MSFDAAVRVGFRCPMRPCLGPSDAGQVVRLRGGAHGGQPQRRNRQQERAGDHNGLGDAWPGGGGAEHSAGVGAAA